MATKKTAKVYSWKEAIKAVGVKESVFEDTLEEMGAYDSEDEEFSKKATKNGWINDDEDFTQKGIDAIVKFMEDSDDDEEDEDEKPTPKSKKSTKKEEPKKTEKEDSSNEELKVISDKLDKLIAAFEEFKSKFEEEDLDEDDDEKEEDEEEDDDDSNPFKSL